MFGFFFLLKGGFIVVGLRKVFMLVWNKQIKNILLNESEERGYSLHDISKPERKAKKNSPFVIDSNHVNDGDDWIYYRIVQVAHLISKKQSIFWVKIILDKEGKHKTDWKLSPEPFMSVSKR